MQGAEAGAVDGYLEQVLPVMEADLFGEVAEAKEVDVFAAKYRQGSSLQGSIALSTTSTCCCQQAWHNVHQMTGLTVVCSLHIPHQR